MPVFFGRAANASSEGGGSAARGWARGRKGDAPEGVSRLAQGPLVEVRDGALPPPNFRALASRVRALGTEGLRRTYRTTFWFELGAAPAALPELAIEALASRIASAGRGVRGVEWWLSRMRTSDVQVDFHRDRDEVRFARTGREVHPVRSSVLFLNRCRGGLLAVVDGPPRDDRPARAPDPFDADLVRPWPNRLATFAGDATHGVLDARNRIPAQRLAQATPLRLAVVMNGWACRPEGVRTFEEAKNYRSLALQ